jgi:hypothetical protein
VLVCCLAHSPQLALDSAQEQQQQAVLLVCQLHLQGLPLQELLLLLQGVQQGVAALLLLELHPQVQQQQGYSSAPLRVPLLLLLVWVRQLARLLLQVSGLLLPLVSLPHSEPAALLLLAAQQAWVLQA